MVWLSERLGLAGPGMDATLWLAQQRRSERVERVNEEKACSPRKCVEDKGRLSCNYFVTTFIKLSVFQCEFHSLTYLHKFVLETTLCSPRLLCMPVHPTSFFITSLSPSKSHRFGLHPFAQVKL